MDLSRQIDKTDCEHGYVQTGGGTRTPCPWPGCKAGINLGLGGVLVVPVFKTPASACFDAPRDAATGLVIENRRFRRLRLGTYEPYTYCWKPIA
jgi:hypothetical protein